MTEGVWRFIVDRNSYADFSVSVSPAVERAVTAGEAPPTVFLNLFDRDSITVGVNEDPEQVLNVEYCRARGIDFRRRVNGGGGPRPDSPPGPALDRLPPREGAQSARGGRRCAHPPAGGRMPLIVPGGGKRLRED